MVKHLNVYKSPSNGCTPFLRRSLVASICSRITGSNNNVFWRESEIGIAEATHILITPLVASRVPNFIWTGSMNDGCSLLKYCTLARCAWCSNLLSGQSRRLSRPQRPAGEMSGSAMRWRRWRGRRGTQYLRSKCLVPSHTVAQALHQCRCTIVLPRRDDSFEGLHL